MPPSLLRTMGYNVFTARGSMTPATFAAFVTWQVDVASSAGFVNRWNAFFHAIEDKLSSRLLQQLHQPVFFAGMHVVRNEEQLTAEVLAAEMKVADDLVLRPIAIDRFEVVLLTES